MAALRTITAVIGSAPSAPHTMLPVPWAMSSLLYSVRGPECSRSTAAALNRDSADAIRVNATTVPSSPMPASSPKALSGGGWTAPSRPFTSTVATGRSSANTASVASPTAASGPGTVRTFSGACFHSSSTAMVPAATAREDSAPVSPKESTSVPGSSAILPRPESGALAAIAG